MIFQRALLRELAGFAVAVFLTLFAIALTTQLVRLLGRAAGGDIPSDAVLAYLGFAGGFAGILVWPAVILHAILSALLARTLKTRKRAKP